MILRINIDFLAYANCVNEPFCAAKTIQNYMKKFGQVSITTNFDQHPQFLIDEFTIGLQWGQCR